jgi:hypothetical protein
MDLSSNSRSALGAALLSVFAIAAGCSISAEPYVDAMDEAPIASTSEELERICSIRCAAPPEGCHYEGALLTGPCNKVTCGKLVCQDVCSILCLAPPEGCRYVGSLTHGPCDKVTCGKLVCGGPRDSR